MGEVEVVGHGVCDTVADDFGHLFRWDLDDWDGGGRVGGGAVVALANPRRALGSSMESWPFRTEIPLVNISSSMVDREVLTSVP